MNSTTISLPTPLSWISKKVRYGYYDPCQWECEVSIQSLNFKDTGQQKNRTRFLWARLVKKTNFQTFGKKSEKNNSGGRCWAKIGSRIGSRKSQADVCFEAAGFRVLDRHRSTKPTTHDYATNSERSALVRGSDPP